MLNESTPFSGGRSDRRHGRRVRLGSDEALYLNFGAGLSQVMAKVIDISGRGMRVVVRDYAAALEPGSKLADAFLVADGCEDRHVAGLEVKELSTGEHGGFCARLAATDDRSRAALWLGVEDMSRSATEATQASFQTMGRLPQIPGRGTYTEIARMERLEYARKVSGSPLGSMSETSLLADKLTGNIENLIGAVEVPVGLCGPLLFRGQKAKGLIYAPLATTEGALVASATRGATAISRSEGVRTRVISQQMIRVPLFVLTDQHGAFLFTNWIRDHFDEIRDQTTKVSRHADLVAVEPFLLGNMVHVRFVYRTGDAAGQNMTTTCTWKACQWLMEQMKFFRDIRFESFMIEGNMSGDKKVNFQSFISGRGTRVIAESFLTNQALEKVLKVTPEQLCALHLRAMTGSMQVGMIGFNINVANIIAAIFTATGQDIACVHESGLGQFHLQQVEGGVYASMLLPSLIVGTVGGGTHLPKQNDMLDIMGCAGPNKVSRLAEIIAGYCLALDLSTLSAVASGQFAAAHERLGRNRPVQWFTRGDLRPRFFQDGVRRVYGDPKRKVEKAEPIKGVQLGSSIISELTARKVTKLVGHLPFRLTHRGRDGERIADDVIVKVKALDQEAILMVNGMAAMCGGRLAAAHRRFKERTGLAHSHIRECAIYQQTDPRFVRHAPRVFDVHTDPSREAFVIVLERLKDMVHLDSADDTSGWTKRHIESAIAGAADLHSIWYDREATLRAQPWLGPVYNDAANMIEMQELWNALGSHAAEEFPEWFDRDDLERHRRVVRGVSTWARRLDAMPKTLVHNDFNPRNICLRPVKDELVLCAYDWELATLGVPQHDLAELLVFVLRPDVDADEMWHYVELHRRMLERAAAVPIDRDEWAEGFTLSLRELAVNRISLYLMAHTFRHYPFMERVIRTLRRLLDLTPSVSE